MSSRYKFWNEYAAYFVTFATVDWIDVFTRNEYRQTIADSLNFCVQNKGLRIHAWVLMTNHIHLLVSLQHNNHYKLSDIMRDLKKYTAMQIIKQIKENLQESRKNWMLSIMSNAGTENSQNKNYQLWRHDNHPLEIKDRKHYDETVRYIHDNPVNAGFVTDSEYYAWSSAIDYCDNKGYVVIDFL